MSKTLHIVMLLALFLLGGGNFLNAQETVSVDLSKGYKNAEAVTTINTAFGSIVFDGGTNSNAPKYYTSGTAVRLYGGNTITFNAGDNVITKVVFTHTQAQVFTETAFNPTGTSYNLTNEVETWTGSSSSLVVTVPDGKKPRITKIEVTYQNASGKKSAGLAYNPTESTIHLGDEFTQPVLANPNNLAITYSSDNEAVATVDADGTITPVAVGEATITASSAENDEFAAGKATFALTVKAAIDKNSIIFSNDYSSWKNAPTSYPTTAQDKVFPASNNENYTFSLKYIMKNSSELQFKKSEGQLVSPKFGFANGYKVTVAYRLSSAIGANMTLTDGTKTVTGEDGTVELEVAGDVAFTLSAGKNAAYVSTITIVPNKAAETVSISLNKYGYATAFYSDKALTVPTGVTATAYDDDVKAVATYSEGQTIPAGEAVILQGSANTTAKFTVDGSSTSTATASNALHGFDEASTTTGDGKFYMLSAKSGKVGFYWGAADGGAFTSGAHKAYLVVPEAKAKTSYVFGEETTDGINSVMSEEGRVKNTPVYNLAGQRVNKAYKGVVIVNGKKFIQK